MEKLKSYWTTEYVGAHTNILIKKLERALNISALDKQTERVILNGNKIEKADFFVEHNAEDWIELVYRMIELSGKLSRDIQLCGDATSYLYGTIDISDASKSMGSLQVPSGLLAVYWQIRLDQTYPRSQYLAKSQKPMW